MAVPNEVINLEAIRLAQAAMTQAQAATHNADTAIRGIESHEKVCAERYSTINLTLSAIQQSQAALTAEISSLNVGNAESVGKWKAISYMSLIIGAVYTVYRIAGGVL